MTPEEALLLGLKTPKTIFIPNGCANCRKTGYKGRLAISEILVFDQELDELLLTTTSKASLKSRFQEKGFVPMHEDGRRRVISGDTSLNEVIRAIDLREGI